MADLLYVCNNNKFMLVAADVSEIYQKQACKLIPEQLTYNHLQSWKK
jgi:hypothetical protein